MLIACIVVVGVLAIFVLTTFLMTYKNYKFDLDGGQLKITNMGSHLKIYFKDNLIKDVFSPKLLEGELIDFSIGDKEYKLYCKCNWFGNKLKLDIIDGEITILSNGVKLKTKTPKKWKKKKKINYK